MSRLKHLDEDLNLFLILKKLIPFLLSVQGEIYLNAPQIGNVLL